MSKKYLPYCVKIDTHSFTARVVRVILNELKFGKEVPLPALCHLKKIKEILFSDNL